jgi:hypothetical protein
MEAAHKNLLQHLLKLFRQRFTMAGLQQMILLSVVYNRIKNFAIKKAA